ncbi:manno(fructo)kinase [Candidatus Defluviicoccus seviourii]|uniref:Manno(Fructo)kinase n=1 Tax=Candidatus Defluviicoccus seviourii TaxID=2565273 RepID=A0A564WFY9_9PROT|nr:manno(fructo)kinase [Candidatus Defluviicoccus seviourii]
MRIGIDLGGTKIEGIVLDAAGEVRWRRRVATPRDDYAGTLATVARLVQALEQDCGARCSVGVGIPGTLSAATGRVKNANATWLNDRALDADLVQALGRPIRLANDANCLAVSEASDGAGAGTAVVFGVILGTGVGGGIVVHGRPLAGANGIAGEWGHNPLPWPGPDEQPGPPCYCGKHGCIETFLSGPGFQRDFEEATGQALAPPEIVARAVAGEPVAAAALCRYEHRLARALASVINVLDPDVIVLAGGMSNIERLYASVPALWRAFVFSDAVVTRLARNHHGDSSGVRGAAWLWPAGAPSEVQLPS